MRILLVEDEPLLRSVLNHGLRSSGIEVTVAPSGESALQLLEAEEFDLIIVDVLLSRMSGIDLLVRLRSEGSTTPVILLSDVFSETNIVFGLESGADAYLTKPFSLRRLTAQIWAIYRRVQMDRHGDPIPPDH